MYKTVYIYNCASHVCGELTDIIFDKLSNKYPNILKVNEFKELDSSVLYIIICPAGLNSYKIFPEKYIVYQLETHIYKHSNGWMKNPEYLNFLKKSIKVWDYSEENIRYLNSMDITNTFYLPVGYHPVMTSEITCENKDIDVLFLGDFLHRRIKICDEIKNRGYNVVTVRGKGYKELLPLINRSKICLNIHAFENNILETVRLSLLLSNNTMVISENCIDKDVQKRYQNGFVIFTDYSNLVDTTCHFLNYTDLRNYITFQSHEWYKTQIFELPDIL